MGEDLVVTNGDQTDTIVEEGDFFRGCLKRRFEPDAPNFTPRISSIIHKDGSFAISILKHAESASNECTREFFVYEGVEEGAGYFISTYQETAILFRALPASRRRSRCPSPTRSGQPSTRTTRSASTRMSKALSACSMHAKESKR